MFQNIAKPQHTNKNDNTGFKMAPESVGDKYFSLFHEYVSVLQNGVCKAVNNIIWFY